MSRVRKRRIKKYIYGIAICLLLGLSVSGVFYFLNSTSIEFDSTPENIISVDRTILVDDVKIALSEHNLPFSEVTVSSESGSLVARLTQGTEVLFTQDKSIEWQIASLQEILTRLTIESRVPSRIDLRHSRPIVKF